MLAAIAILTMTTRVQAAGEFPTGFQSSYQTVSDYWWERTYLEGFDLPVASGGPTDIAISPDGSRAAVSAKGYIWIVDLANYRAVRFSDSPSVDTEPSWSPDGKRIAFVRDDGHDTAVIVRTISGGAERVINSRAVDLNPVFSADGTALYLSSAMSGDLNLWRVDLASGRWTELKREHAIQVRATVSADGKSLAYLARTPTGKIDELRIRDLATGDERILRSGFALTQTRLAFDPTGNRLAFTWPEGEGWTLKIIAPRDPLPGFDAWHQDAPPLGLASGADQSLFYSDWTGARDAQLARIEGKAREPRSLAIATWDWGRPIGTLAVRLTKSGRETPARVSIQDERGHPVIPDGVVTRYDPQNRKYYFYSDGRQSLTLPAGAYTITAVQGLLTPPVEQKVSVGKEEAGAELALVPVWDTQAAGYLSGDHHFHLNYGGQILLKPDDLVPMMNAEALDVATPLVANLHTRLLDARWKAWPTSERPPFVAFGQEVRSGFNGHLGIVGARDVLMPSFWGPRDAVFSDLGRSNGDALADAKADGAEFEAYVHPTLSRDPLNSTDLHSLPTELISDMLLGSASGLEIVCLWSDELGSSALWYDLLNLGIAVTPTAGSDAFPNISRSMAVGTARVFVDTGGSRQLSDYYKALRAGRSIVTNGPVPVLSVAGVSPGNVIPSAHAKVPWRIELHTATPLERVELIVNGAVVWRTTARLKAGSAVYTGSIDLPEGGWVAARAVGENTGWPAMDSYVFGHTAPIWIGAVASFSPDARRAAATRLLAAENRVLDRARAAYGKRVATPLVRIQAVIRCLARYANEALPGKWSCLPGPS